MRLFERFCATWLIGFLLMVPVIQQYMPAKKSAGKQTVVVPADRIALPSVVINCECLKGNGCHCDNCRCENGESVVEFIDEPAKPEPPLVPKPEPEPKVLSVDPVTSYPATRATVVMITRDWCGECVKWKNGPMPGELRAKGWDVHIDDKAPATVFPSYRVFDGNQWHTVRGPLTGLKLRLLLKYKPAVPMRERVEVKPTGVQWLLDGQPWTRDTLIDHLAEHSNHGYDRDELLGMSFDELQQLHNSDHEGRDTARKPLFGGRLLSRNR